MPDLPVPDQAAEPCLALPLFSEVRELMLGADGAVAALRGGTTWIDMTSNSPAAVTEIRDAVLGQGAQVLDAPAGGGVAAARHGAPQLLVGGQAWVVEQHRELLEVLASPGQLRHVGGYGAGYTVKLLINLNWPATITFPSRRLRRWLISTSAHCAGTGRQTGNCWP